MRNNRDQARELKTELELKTEASIALQNEEHINKVIETLENIRVAVEALGRKIESLELKTQSEDFRDKTKSK
ncbi:hypothetical protein BKH41_02790 [Helicobacter sp. 12S02232-10]|uniref:hypothetical protein n=1 Tax=Helicobacter sp. 12S02232-10 TaxID=1476197 RepID=UPI000BA69DDB|nr:hypothetical protein [Helicobacter sp. 12S02232-10]PAF49608.1 hypothetical protein BKH41_02790 [Helicobacter sp. 12S02232-10]